MRESVFLEVVPSAEDRAPHSVPFIVSPSLLCASSESLPVDKIGGVPLSMDQYPMLYSCNRIPGEKADTQRRTPPTESLHCIVAHNGHVSTNRAIGL